MFDDQVPVVEINRHNLERLLPLLKDAIDAADFIAIDLELSGLGDYRGMKNQPFCERYGRIRDSAATRSIYSVGFAVFKLSKTSEEKMRVRIKCQVFNLMVMNSLDYVVEPSALAFLARHGFDFNKLIASAILYSPKKSDGVLRDLLTCTLASGAALIFHNGFIDLAFLYHNFFRPLPESLGAFQSSLNDWFEHETEDPEKLALLGGRGLFFDSKFAAQSEGFSLTTLEYVFRKSQRSNVLECRDARVYLSIKFQTAVDGVQVLPSDVDYVDCTMSVQFLRNDFVIDSETKRSICSEYAKQGYCRRRDCSERHDIDLLLDLECAKAAKKQAKRQRRYEKQGPVNKKTRGLPGNIYDKVEQESDGAEAETQAPYESTKFSTKGCHRAGMDAFMTGFSLLFSQRMHLLRHRTLDRAVANRMRVPGLEKDLPLLRSSYTPTSEEHKEAWLGIRPLKIVNVKLKAGIFSSDF